MITQTTIRNTKFRKWLTSSAMPVLIFSMSLQMFRHQINRYSDNFIDSVHQIFSVNSFKIINLTYSVMRLAKLVFPATTSYQAISCRINDSKYLMRIRVTCRIAVRLKQSTPNIPNTNCHIVANNVRIP